MESRFPIKRLQQFLGSYVLNERLNPSLMQPLDNMRHEFNMYDSCSNIVDYHKATVRSGCLIPQFCPIIFTLTFPYKCNLHFLIRFKTILFSRNMDTLPPELIGNILRHLKKKRRLTPFALISRTWHEEVERITFSSLSIKNTELATFASILSNQPNNLNRRKYLRRLRFEIQIQKFQVAKGKSLLDEIDKQKQHNKATFTKAIRNLFETLSSWDLRQSIDLELYMRDPKPDLLGFDISFCETAEFTSWEDLPTLSCVRSLICGVPLALNVFMHIVRALPKLWHLSWWIMEEDDNINSLARRKARYGKSRKDRNSSWLSSDR